jgi:hypothetical protein
MARKRKRLLAALVAIVACLFIAAWVTIRQLQKLNAARQLAMEGSPTVEQMVSLLDYSDTIVLRNTLTQLEHSGSEAGRERAVELLGHSDIYVSYGSALYLGSIGDHRSVPYLIRGLDHPASRSRPRLVQYLKTLTHQDFGETKDQWVGWWKSQNPGSSFDFTTKKP